MDFLPFYEVILSVGLQHMVLIMLIKLVLRLVMSQMFIYAVGARFIPGHCLCGLHGNAELISRLNI